MQNKTGYPSIDNTHKKNEKFTNLHPIIPNLSFYNSLKLMSSFYRKNEAIDCLDLSVSYDELLKDAVTISKTFKELGVKAGDIISVAMPNFYQAVATYLAANRIGAITTFLNPYSSIEEIKEYLNLFESPVFLNYDKNIEYNKEIKKDTKVNQIITLDQDNVNIKKFDDTSKLIGYNDFLKFKDLKLVGDFYKKPIWTNYAGNQESLILFTSGTTGNPKSVVLTNKNILASGIYMKHTGNVQAKADEKCLICVPFSYPYGFATSLLMALLCGRSSILAPELSNNNISYYLEKNPNYIFGSPALLELIKRNTPEKQNLSSIHSFISGGDFLTPSQSLEGREFFKQHNADVQMYNGSGNAESGGASTIAVGAKIRPETVGKVLVGSDAIIVNQDTMEELKYNEEGLLCISGKHIFKEYYKEPKLTKEAKFEYKGKTYLKTGTRGFLDEEGYFTLTGRDSRYYIISTLNKIYCDHVQNIISLIDVIDACAVVKKPNDENLFTSKVFIVLKDGIEPTKEIKDYIISQCGIQLTNPNTNSKVQLKPYEIPTSFEFVDKLPRTQADKIDYKTLEEEAKEEYNQEKGSVRVRKI